MTTPEVQTIERNGSRSYVDPVSGAKVPSVTFVLGHDPEPMSLSCPCVGVSCTERAGNLVLVFVVRLRDSPITSECAVCGLITPAPRTVNSWA